MKVFGLFAAVGFVALTLLVMVFRSGLHVYRSYTELVSPPSVFHPEIQPCHPIPHPDPFETIPLYLYRSLGVSCPN